MPAEERHPDLRVLVTNDDGVDAPGLHALVVALDAAGYHVVVAAPLDDRSGAGASIGNLQPGGSIHTERRMLPGLEHIEAHGVDGPPALAVMAARLGGFGPPPDVVVSGINPGNNTGRATLHSGTVGAALTASNLGVSGLAVSIGWAGAPRWATAGAVAVATLEWLLTAPERTVVNVNVPDCELADLKGVRWAELAPFGTVRAALDSDGTGGPLQIELTEVDVVLPADSDSALVMAGYAAVTTIVGIRATAPEPLDREIERLLDLGPGSSKAESA